MIVTLKNENSEWETITGDPGRGGARRECTGLLLRQRGVQAHDGVIEFVQFMSLHDA